MNPLLASVILFLTSVLAVFIGIFTTYAAVIAILGKLAPQSQHEPAVPAGILVPSETHAGGD